MISQTTSTTWVQTACLSRPVSSSSWKNKRNISLRLPNTFTKKNVGSHRYALMANEERLRTWTLSLREGQAKHPAATPSCQSYYKSKDGQVYFFPYKFSKYQALIKKVNFRRDWVLLVGRPGQPHARVTEVD